MSKVSVVKLIAGYELVIAVVWNLYVVMKLEGGAGWEEMAPGGEAMAPGGRRWPQVGRRWLQVGGDGSRRAGDRLAGGGAEQSRARW